MSLVIGIDIGGSKIKGVLMDDTGKVTNVYERPTEADKPREEILNNILEVINKLRAQEVERLGIATPGFALPNGRMACMPNIKKLEGFKLKKELERGTGLRVFLENDANCFAFAEQRRGSAKGCKNVIGVIIGTGVGTGIIINSEIYRGAIGGAGECGHTKLVVDSEVKEVEDLIAGPSIIKRYEQLSSNKADDPWVMLNKKDVFAQKVYEEFVLFTGLFFSNLINTFNPEMIVVGGGVSNIPFYKDVDKVVNKYAQPDMVRVCRIKKNALGDDSGVLGATELALKQP
jgi:predicted NBD/HSP70 family sugar kinase